MPTPLFLAVGQQGARLTSADGVTWSAEQTGKEGEIYRGCAIGNARLVAAGTFGGSNIFASSPDAKSWKTSTKDGQYKLFVRSVGYGTPNNKPTFVAVGGEPVTVGSSNPFALLSEDGVTWSDYDTISGKNILRRLAWGNDRFVAVGDRGRRSMAKDGRTWTDVEKVKAIDTLIDVVYGKNLFVGVGLHGLRMYSEDGLTWSDRIPGEEGEHLNSICFTGDRFVAVAPGATYTSDDGRKWSRTPTPPPPPPPPHPQHQRPHHRHPRQNQRRRRLRRRHLARQTPPLHRRPHLDPNPQRRKPPRSPRLRPPLNHAQIKTPVTLTTR